MAHNFGILNKSVLLTRPPQRSWAVWHACLFSIMISCHLLSPVSGLAAERVTISPYLVKPTRATTTEFLETLKKSPTGVLYGLADFSRHPSQQERTRLTSIGLHVLEPYFKTSYWVRLTYNDIPYVPMLDYLTISLAKLSPEDRVDHRIWQKDYADFSFVSLDNTPLKNYVLNADGTLNLTVRFHADIPESHAMKLIARFSKAAIKKNVGTWQVVASRSDLLALAKDDIVQWIGAGPQPQTPITENEHTRAGIGVNLVQKFIPSTEHAQVTGAGVRIGIFDMGIDESHQDFAGRIIVSSAGKSHHATAMAGIIAASGRSSPSGGESAYQWRGIATEAQLYDEPLRVGDESDVHRNLIRDPGMQLSNHSYFINDRGEYTISDRDRDDIIKGIAPHYLYPRLHVYAAGNYGCVDPPERNPSEPIRCIHVPYQTGYFSLTKQLKNGLLVGNWNHAGMFEEERRRHQIYYTSSLGPTSDGRIKPDVVAPGTHIRSTRAFSSDYGYSTGTSSAAAAVTGSLALVLEAYRKSYHIEDLNHTFPLPSTLRALVIQTADDVTLAPCPSGQASTTPWFDNADGPVEPTCGPDFATGWGLVNVDKAVQHVVDQLVLEGTVEEECDTSTYLFDVKSADPVRVTVAWDDVPYAGPQYPSTLRKLVNDLDLRLIDPNGHVYYPWKLDQTIVDSNDRVIPDPLQHCALPIEVTREFVPTATPRTQDDKVPTDGIPSAVRGTDHLNNVEVVDAPSAMGTWKAQVTGFSVMMGPQRFSLVGQHFYEAPSK